MKLEDYPTPETDACQFDMLVNNYPNIWEKVTPAEHSQSLERRLAAQTECLNRICNTVMTVEQIERLVEETLTLTAKP